MTRNFTSVLNLDCLLDWLIDENIPEIDLLLCQICFRTKALTFQLKGKPLLCTGNVTVCHTVVSTGRNGHECDSYGDLRVWPYFPHQRLNPENLILKQEQVVLNCFSDSLILPGQWQFSPFSLPLQVLTMVKLLLRGRIIPHIILLLLILLRWVDNLSQQHQLFSLFLL